MQHFRIEFDETNQKLSEICECCGTTTRTVWGFVYRHDEPFAVYYVNWTPGHEPRNAIFDFVVGDYGEGSSSEGRRAFCLEYREGSGVRAIDSAGRPAASLARVALTRDEFLALPEKDELFFLWDTIYLTDERLEGIRARPQ